ncbi:hypothetical protein [Corynebacterium parakroppenstedtii]|uniref:hypothetical protein n=1 Tax=Corynebacterium parakroppenstedtii TaxID=2828363 RepID=UPI001C8D3A32|nr:hypothetical protein [Corynebacterium parakroppenstedtii]MBY0789370.1 hypothetical protein [Corynebacterium parakroppenstedtii]
MNSAVFLILGALLLLAAAALLWAANRPADDREWRRVLNRHAGVHERPTSSRGGRANRAPREEGASGGSRDASDGVPFTYADAGFGDDGDALPPRRRNPRFNPQQTQTADQAFSHFGVRPQAEAEEERADEQESFDDGLADDDVSVTHPDERDESQHVQHGATSRGDGEDNAFTVTHKDGDEHSDTDSPSRSVPAGETGTAEPGTASESPADSAEDAAANPSTDTPQDAMEEWFENPTRATRRARRSWAAEHGWQFDRNDPDLAHEWADHVGASSSEAKDVVSGRMRARRAHVADIDDNSYLGLRRSGSSDILIDFRDRDRWVSQNQPGEDPSHIKPPRPDQEYVGSCGGFAVFSSDPLSVRLMMDSRADRALAHLRGTTAAIVIDPWWILVRCSRRPTIDDIPRIFAYIADLDDATRVLPNPTAEYLDMTDGDPGRAYSYDIFTLGDGPRMQAVPDAGFAGQSATAQSAADQPAFGQSTGGSQSGTTGQSDSADVGNNDEPAGQEGKSDTDAHIGWSDRPEFRHEYVDLPRRDRSRREGNTTDDEQWDEVGKSTGDIPVVGSDLDHSGAHERSGRVIRVESDYDKSTIFGDPPSEGRHRKSSARRGASHRREDDDVPIVDGELEPENRLDQD